MKIGIDGRLWNESGVGRYIRNLVKGIDEKKLTGHEFTVFLNPKAYPLVNFESRNFRKIESGTAWHTISEQISFKKTLEKESLDLVHFPYFSYPIFYDKPFVITIHDLIIDHFPTGMASSLPLPFYYAKYVAYKGIIRSAVKNAKKIIVPSYATRDELNSHYGAVKEKIEVVYEGFDPLISENSVKEKLVSKNYILYVGNAYPHKNLSKLIEAYKTLSSEIDVDLICIGRSDFFYNRLKKKETKGVYFLHDVDDSQLFEYYSHAKVFVMPSLMEGFGLPILEAMNLSCPVVCSEAQALKEIAGGAAVYCDPKNGESIANAINKILKDNTLRKKLIDKGLNQAKKFSWGACVDETLKVYESCNSV